MPLTSNPQLDQILFLIFISFLGVIFGSFLNVVIYRVPLGKSVIFPSSSCTSCGARIRAYDNIPVISWLILRGKCRNCGNRISPRYVFVEIANGVLWLMLAWRFGPTASLILGCVFCSVLLVLAFIDAQHMILPDVITFPLFFFAIFSRLLNSIFGPFEIFQDQQYWPANQLNFMPPIAVNLVIAFLGALIGAGILWAFAALWKRLRGVEAMGFGDVKLMLGIGAFLGWQLALLTIFAGAVIGSFAGALVIASRRQANLQSQIPFGIFLGLGAILSVFAGNKLLEWYLGFYN
ncbi:MAG TPA: prepilin peptidase [Pyrinomonadaceae bacterium]|nr:prepilin peptidase [Pyrinomonadaceae bacterium]